MSAIIRQISPVSLFPVAGAPVAAIREAVVSVAVAARAAAARIMAPRPAGRHVKDVDLVSVSRWNGYGRDSIGWNDIGYRI